MDATSHVTLQVVGSDQTVHVQLGESSRMEVLRSQEPRSVAVDLPATRFLPIHIWENGKLLWEGTVFLDGQETSVLTFRLADDGRERIALRVGTIAEVPSVVSTPPGWVGAAWGGLVLGFCLVAVQVYRRVDT